MLVMNAGIQDITEVELRDFHETVMRSCIVDYAEPTKIRAPMDGNLSGLVSYEDKVEKTELLASYDTEKLQRDIRIAKSSHATLVRRIANVDGPLTDARRRLMTLEEDAIRQRVEQARQDREQALSIAENGRLAQSRLDDFETAFRKVQDELVSIEIRRAIFDMETDLQLADLLHQKLVQEAQLEELTENLSKARLTSPVDGIVSYVDPRLMQEHSRLDLRAGAHIFSLSPPDLRWTYIKMTASEADRLRDADVVIRSPQGDDVQGRIVDVRPLENTAAWEKEKFEFTVAFQDTDDHFAIGTEAVCDLTAPVAQDVPSIPVSFLIDTPQGRAVHVLKNGIEQQMPVQSGRVDFPFIEILSGVVPGDRISRP